MTDISSGKVPVIECVVASWRFLFENWRQLLPAALVASAISTLAPLIIAAGGAASFGMIVAATLVTMLADVVLAAAVLRKAVRNEFVPPLGVGLGQDEFRLIAVLASFGLLLAPPIVVLAFIYTAIALGQAGLTESEIEAMASDPDAVNRIMMQAASTPPGALVCVVGVLLFALLFTRLYLVNAATIGEKRIVFFQTWSWSKGNVLRIFAAIVVTLLPAILISAIVSEILAGLVPASAGLVAITARVFVASVIGAFLSIPPTALGAQLYKGLRPPDFVAK
jgi:hypothetical protein